MSCIAVLTPYSVHFANFSVATALGNNSRKCVNVQPLQETAWDRTVPRLARSADGQDLLYYIPKAFTPDWTVSTQIRYYSHTFLTSPTEEHFEDHLRFC